MFQSDFLPARLVRFTSFGAWLVAGASLVACSAEPPGEETMPVTVPSSSQPVPTASVPTPGAPTELPPGPGVNPTSTNPGTVSPPPEPVNPVTPSGSSTEPATTTTPMPTGPTPSVEPTTDPSTTAPTDPTGPTDPQPPPDDDDDVTPSLIGDVQFSVPSSTFTDAFDVTLSGPEGAEIRYTIDGTPAGPDSTLFDGTPVAITETTELRAQAFVDGLPSGFSSTVMYIQRTFDVPSDVPLMIIEGFAGGRPQKSVSFGGGGMTAPPEPQPWFRASFMLFDTKDGQASLANLPDVATRAGYRERGQSSANAEKSPYRLELWDNVDQDADYSLLGMEPEADWALIGEFYDKTQIRNSLVYSWGRELGLVTMDLRFAELYINFDGGPLEQSDFFGLYAITEKIKNQKFRVDLKQLDGTETDPALITGGYILKFDQAALDGGEVEIECTGSDLFGGGSGFGGGGTTTPTGHCFDYLGIVDPELPNEAQVQYLTTYIQELHNILHTEPMGNYGEYIDVQSFVDHLIIGELTRDVDAYVRSHYWHKDRDGKLVAGPLWDYNFSLNSTGSDVEGWHFESQAQSRRTQDWFLMLGSNPEFMGVVAARWRELRAGMFADQAVSERITELTTPIANAGQRDLERWPPGQGGGFGGFGGGGQQEDPPETWQDHVDVLREWIPQRMAWLDNAFAAF